MIGHCQFCKFWVRDENEQLGVCHRYPPTSAVIDGSLCDPAAMTHQKYWCGEYQPEQEPEPPAPKGLRVSSIESDPGFATYRQHKTGWRVILDGKIVENTITADEDEGLIVQAITTSTGQVVTDYRDNILTRTLRGVVKVEKR